MRWQSGELLENLNLIIYIYIVDDKEFESLKLASKYIGSKINNLSTALCKGKTTYKGHSIRYGNQQPSQGKSDNSTLEGSTTNG